MTPKDKELMERYTYQVTRRLPKSQRAEVELELQELIEDMLEESSSIDEVLTKLGDPTEFAKKYRDDTHHLIGPEYYDTYLWFVKIVLICTAIPILAVTLIEGISEGIIQAQTNYFEIAVRAISQGLGSAIAECIVSCSSAFGIITLIFAIMEREKVKINLGNNSSAEKNWTPEALSPVPDKNATISRSDSVVGIIFIVIFCVLLIFVPEFFSVVLSDKSYTTVPIFNLEQWSLIMPVFVLSMLIGIADEILRLIVGCYCKIVMISNIISGVLQIALSTVVLKMLPLWNPDFISEVKTVLEKESTDIPTYLINWDENTMSNFILGCLTVIILFEIAVTVYRTLRYGTERKA